MEPGILLAVRDAGVRHPRQSNAQEVVRTDRPRWHDFQQPLLDADPRMRGLDHAARSLGLAFHRRDAVAPQPLAAFIDFRYAQVCMRLGQIAKSAVWCRPGSSDGRAT